MFLDLVKEIHAPHRLQPLFKMKENHAIYNQVTMEVCKASKGKKKKTLSFIVLGEQLEQAAPEGAVHPRTCQVRKMLSTLCYELGSVEDPENH